MVPADSPEVLARFKAELPLVDVVARQLRREVGSCHELEELVSFGREGLLIAARRFDPDRGVPFRRFANYRVRGAILDGMRAHGHIPRRAHEKLRALRAANLVAEGFHEDNQAALAAGLPAEAADERLAAQLAVLATAMAVGFSGPLAVGDDGELVAVDSGESPEFEAARSQLVRIVGREVDQLPELEATFVRRHFYKDEPIDQISEDLGFSKSWGSRLLSRAIATLTKRVQQASG
ncbi:MAG: sigma-70 family RNA polymerase sigma factor [Polyangiaceae bacterium]|nr:sigma-70 family RNA polymerase sigma factor [Polyangiaceae bacterium]